MRVLTWLESLTKVLRSRIRGEISESILELESRLSAMRGTVTFKVIGPADGYISGQKWNSSTGGTYQVQDDFKSEVVSGMDHATGKCAVRIGIDSLPTTHHIVINLDSIVVWVQCQPQIHSASGWATTAARTTGSLARYKTIEEDIAAVDPTVVN
jgi:hypothetical protein